MRVKSLFLMALGTFVISGSLEATPTESVFSLCARKLKGAKELVQKPLDSTLIQEVRNHLFSSARLPGIACPKGIRSCSADPLGRQLSADRIAFYEKAIASGNGTAFAYVEPSFRVAYFDSILRMRFPLIVSNWIDYLDLDEDPRIAQLEALRPWSAIGFGLLYLHDAFVLSAYPVSGDTFAVLFGIYVVAAQVTDWVIQGAEAMVGDKAAIQSEIRTYTDSIESHKNLHFTDQPGWAHTGVNLSKGRKLDLITLWHPDNGETTVLLGYDPK